MTLDDYIAEKVQQVAPHPLVVSETALLQLRPLFAELMEYENRVKRATNTLLGFPEPARGLMH
jgi:hypothetical protein